MLSESGGEGQTTASASVTEGVAKRGDDRPNGSSGLSQSMTSLMRMLSLSLLLMLLRR